MACVIPDELGFGPLTRKELKEAAAELGGQAGRIDRDRAAHFRRGV